MDKDRDIARRLNGIANEMENAGETLVPLHEVDWEKVHILETVAPMRVVIPTFHARARYAYIKAWRRRIEEGNPGHKELDNEWMSYVIIYRNGKDSPIPVRGDIPHRDRVEPWRWIDPMMLFMNGLNAEVAAVYQIENIEHTEALLIWSRRHHLLAQIPEKDAGEIALEGCIEVRLVPQDEIEALVAARDTRYEADGRSSPGAERLSSEGRRTLAQRGRRSSPQGCSARGIDAG